MVWVRCAVQVVVNMSMHPASTHPLLHVHVLLQGTERVPIAPQGMPFDWHLRPALSSRTMSQRAYTVMNGQGLQPRSAT